MRLTFVPADEIVIIDSVAHKIDTTQLEIPDGLHAIQYYNANDIECEWASDEAGERGALGNSLGTAGLPEGIDFIEQLVQLHTAAQKAEAENEISEEQPELENTEENPE